MNPRRIVASRSTSSEKINGINVGLALAYESCMAFRILVVEDDTATRRGMAQLLTGAGYEVTETASMTDALTLLSTDTPDLVITDLRLAEFNGLYLAAVNPQRIPVIIVTGYADRGLEAEARELGADFMLKPVKPSQLLAVVERRLPVAETSDNFSLARRWPRRRPTSELSARVDDTFVRVLDVSYGGLRFMGKRDAAALAKQSFRITFPKAAISVPVRVVWQHDSESNRLCGAIVPEEWQLHWRQLVDSLS
jgi:DNA-binding response OmpR family regulator